jgi:pilus assembly protein Flp/PilA
MEVLKRLWRCESGATAIEYGLIAGGIAVGLVAVLKGLGKHLTTTFKTLKKAL